MALFPAELLPENAQESLNKYFPFLLEFRKRLLFIAVIFVSSALIGFFYYERIITTLLALLDLGDVNIVFTSPFQFFTLAVNSGLILGLVAAFPLILAQLLSFARPALKRREYNMVLVFLPLSMVLFLGGFLFGVAIMKYVVAIFYQKSVELNIGNLLDIDLLLSKIIMTGIFMGIAFQFPIIMTMLMRFGVVKYKEFVKQRFLAYSTAIIFAAMLPPTDILSLLLLTLPLVLLFEITLLLNKLIFKAHLVKQKVGEDL